MQSRRSWARRIFATLVLAVIATPAQSVLSSAQSLAPAGAAPASDLSWTAPVPASPSASNFGRPQAIACPTISMCVAVGAVYQSSGRDTVPNVLVSDDPSAGATTWTADSLPAAADDGNMPLSDVSCPSPTLCVAVGGDPGVVVTSTDPSGGAIAWQVAVPSVPSMQSISCPSVNLCVGVGQTGGATSTDPAAGGSSWAFQEPEIPAMQTISCPTVDLCVGTVGADVYTSSNPTGGGNAWVETPNVDTQALNSISCPTTTFCAAADNAGDLVTSVDPADGVWSAPESIDPQNPSQEIPPSLSPLSCSSPTLCITSDAYGDVVSSTDPTGGPGDWNIIDLTSILKPSTGPGGEVTATTCPTVTVCTGFDNVGDLVTSDDPASPPRSWTLTTAPKVPDGLTSISCPASDLCVAVNSHGAVVTSTNPGEAGSWTIADKALPAVAGLVSCPSTTLCIAVDQDGDVATSTDPAGGATAWVTTTGVDTNENGMSGLSCPTISFCVATDWEGNVLTSADPSGGASAWSAPEPVAGVSFFDSISCPSASMCLAVGASAGNVGNGLIVTATDPTGGSAAWTVTDLENDEGPLESAACPSTTLCLAVDQSGSIDESTNPTGGFSSWAVEPGGAGNTGFTTEIDALTCPSVGFCVAIDQFGDIATTDQPEIPGFPWTMTGAVEATGVIDDQGDPLTCPTTTLCVAVDKTGNFVAGTPSTAAAPAVKEDPTDTYAVVNESISFTAKATRGSSVRVQWQQGTGTDFGDIIGATSLTLSFRPTSADNDVEYRAEFLGSSRDQLTSAATLRLGNAQKPLMTSANPSATFVVGQGGDAVVHAEGTPTPLLLETGKLPKGLTFRNVGFGYATISGVPLAQRARSVVVQIAATNSLGTCAPQTWMLTIVKS
jgi:hypothetical protein